MTVADEMPLKALGLDRRCALVYTHLCVNGASKAGPIASATRLGRGDVYRALDRLVARGHVVAGKARPTTYSPVDPDEVFARALAENRSRRASLVDAAADLAAWWSQAAASRSSAGGTFRQLEGQAEIAAVARRMVDRSTQLVRILDKRPPRSPGTAPIDTEAIHDGARVELRIVADRSGTASSWFLVVDDAEALFLDEPASPAGDTPTPLRATWTGSPTLVAMAVALHSALWARNGAARERDGR